VGFLGYDRNEVLAYNDKRCCGLWFLIIGIVIIISTIFGGEKKLNPIIFTVGYMFGLYISTINKKITLKLSYGALSKFQNNIVSFSIGILFPLMFILSGPFFPSQNWRMVWLGTFIAVGLHFFPFYFVHGRAMIAIGILGIINALLGILLNSVSFSVFAFNDGVIKMVFGIYLLFFSKSTSYKQHINSESK